MPVIKYQETLKQVMKKPVFGPGELQAEGVPVNYAKKLLHALAASGRIKRIERGKYTCSDDPVIVAANLVKPSYLSLWNAMSIRHLTTQVPFAVDVMTSRRRFNNRINFEGTSIVFHKVSPRLMFGYEKMVWNENNGISVANREKLIIDAVHVGGIPGEQVLQMVQGADVSLLRKYARLAGNKRIEKKVRELIECSRKKK